MEMKVFLKGEECLSLETSRESRREARLYYYKDKLILKIRQVHDSESLNYAERIHELIGKEDISISVDGNVLPRLEKLTYDSHEVYVHTLDEGVYDCEVEDISVTFKTGVK